MTNYIFSFLTVWEIEAKDITRMTNYIFSFLTEWEIEAKEHYPHDQLYIFFSD